MPRRAGRPSGRVLAVARRFAREVARLDPGRLVEATLFGSRARGTARPDSDWDVLLVVTSKDLGWEDEVYGVVERFRSRYGVDISLQIRDITAVSRSLESGSPFLRRVREEGVPLWTRS